MPELPRQLIEGNDELDEEIEYLVSAPKRIGRVSEDRRGRSYRLEAEVRVQGTRQLLRLTILFHGRRGSQVEAILQQRDGKVIRLWHHHPDTVHTNPDGGLIAEPHKHFPTRRYPISGRSHRGYQTWAYTVREIATNDPQQVAEGFCEECNISGYERVREGA